ncbi:hypothetical protein Tco_0514814 [Tanacetum coccineum]
MAHMTNSQSSSMGTRDDDPTALNDRLNWNSNGVSAQDFLEPTAFTSTVSTLYVKSLSTSLHSSYARSVNSCNLVREEKSTVDTMDWRRFSGTSYECRQLGVWDRGGDVAQTMRHDGIVVIFWHIDMIVIVWSDGSSGSEINRAVCSSRTGHTQYTSVIEARTVSWRCGSIRKDGQTTLLVGQGDNISGTCQVFGGTLYTTRVGRYLVGIVDGVLVEGGESLDDSFTLGGVGTNSGNAGVGCVGRGHVDTRLYISGDRVTVTCCGGDVTIFLQSGDDASHL